jgi:hypothetical protein
MKVSYSSLPRSPIAGAWATRHSVYIRRLLGDYPPRWKNRGFWRVSSSFLPLCHIVKGYVLIKLLKNTILATAFLAVSGAYAAPILEVSSDGRLTGASGVEVGGALYDVAFKDGTCAGLFSGCDQAADFQFKSKTEGEAASLALENQVFVDGLAGLFDSAPRATLGCENLEHCAIYTPFAKPQSAGIVTVSKFTNEATGQNFPDRTETVNLDITGTTAGTTASVWAVWTPHASLPATSVPEPGTLSALAIGAFALLRTRRQRSRGARV